MYEINLVCPNCGEHKFYDTDAGTWICSNCEREYNTNELDVTVFSV